MLGDLVNKDFFQIEIVRRKSKQIKMELERSQIHQKR